MSPDYREIIAGTNIEKNPELPSPKKIIGYSPSDTESGQVEVPLTGEIVVPTTKPIPIPKPKIKRSLSIREVDNGWIVEVWAGDWHEEWAMLKLNKLLKTIMAFFSTTME